MNISVHDFTFLLVKCDTDVLKHFYRKGKFLLRKDARKSNCSIHFSK